MSEALHSEVSIRKARFLGYFWRVTYWAEVEPHKSRYGWRLSSTGAVNKSRKVEEKLSTLHWLRSSWQVVEDEK